MVVGADGRADRTMSLDNLFNQYGRPTAIALDTAARAQFEKHGVIVVEGGHEFLTLIYDAGRYPQLRDRTHALNTDCAAH